MKKWIALEIISLSLFLALPVFSATVGEPAPNFSMKDTNGNLQSISQYKGKYVVLEWLNHECPFIKKHYNSKNMQGLQKKHTEKGVIWLSIISSAPGKQGHVTPKEANQLTQEKSAHPTAVILDESGKIGHLYGAKTTPHMFVINPDGVLIYNGAIDDKPSIWEKSVKSAKNYISLALEEDMAKKPLTVSSSKPYGCSVKYKN